MRQLTSLDAQFLALETPRQTGHVGGLAVVDPSTRVDRTFDAAAVGQLLRERLPLLPPFRWRLAEVPLGLDYPYWVDDEDFDLHFHVREIALPSPGSDAQLAEQRLAEALGDAVAEDREAPPAGAREECVLLRGR